jgi:VWFA-related protein
MTICRLVGGAAIACTVLTAPFCAPLAQSQQTAPPMFRASTTVIEVDVVVQDKRGQFVFGLGADDLEILENGKPQPIQQFYLVSHDPLAGKMPESGIAAQTAERGRRVFVLFFDEGSLSPDSLMRVQKGAEAFITQRMGPGDLGGVFAGGQLHQNRVTADRSALLMAAHSAKPVIDHRQSLLAPFREFPRIPGELEAVRIAAGTAPEAALRLAQQNCKEDAVACQYAGGVAAVDNLIEKKSRLYVNQARTQTERTLKQLNYVIDGLSAIPGRKTLVLFSDGFFVEDMTNSIQMLAARAARGGIAIYSIDGRGLNHGMGAVPDVTSASLPRSTEFDTGDTGPVIFTQGTGGFSLRNIDDISRAMNLVASDTSTYYVVGYQPANMVWDGKFRKIEVKARVPGLKIRARKGYAAIPLPR